MLMTLVLVMILADTIVCTAQLKTADYHMRELLRNALQCYTAIVTWFSLFVNQSRIAGGETQLPCRQIVV